MFLQREKDGRKVRSFSLSDSFINEFRDLQPKWGPVGYITYKRTYARVVESEDRTEEFWETCKRVVEGVYNVQKLHCRSLGLPWDDRKSQKSAQEMFRRMWSFKWLPPGRGLWAMGTNLMYEKGGAALNNCAFVSTKDLATDFSAPFCFLMDMSMMGVGVGGDVKGQKLVRLFIPKTTDLPFVVEDSREGWVSLLRTVLDSFVGKSLFPSIIDYSNVRPFGTPIKGFGGVASGHEPLDRLIKNVVKVLTPSKDGEFISSSQIVDVFNYIGVCVVAGNVRRSAEIMFGDPSDEEFRSLKDPSALNELGAKLSSLHSSDLKGSAKDELERKLNDQIANHPLRTHRWASNNSIFAEVGMDYTEIVQSISKNGEPGLIWLDTMRAYGRLSDEPNNIDIKAEGSNPCAEQTLESFELCCLVETFPAHHDSMEDYYTTLKYSYLYAKSVTLVPTHDKRTNAVMMRNRRIGCSQSGIVQAINKFGRESYRQLCDQGYSKLREYDRKYSDWLCVPRSIKVTSVKPSGTVSLLCGASSGIHYPHSKFYIRNIMVSKDSPLLESCREAGYKIESSVYSNDSCVVSFPVKEGNFLRGKNDVSIWEQFSNAALLQRYWADNQVSITVTFRPDEVKDIKQCLEIYERDLKSVSLLPSLDHGYVQAPYIEITEEEYEGLVAGVKPINILGHSHEIDDKFCDGDTCIVSTDQ